jgi:SNF2 family DNA or RNA helicase
MQAMPGLCRAEAVAGAMAGRAPDLILLDMAESCVDACAREFLAEQFKLSLRGRRARSESAEVAWFTALTTAQPNLRADLAGISKLQNLLSAWSSETLRKTAASLRTCFRLTPPESNGDRWQLEFLLQATDDKSLIVGADAIWKTRSGALTVLKRRLDNPQEKFLEDLGRAARLFPEMESALRMAKPVAMELTAEGAYRFLKEAAPLLEQSEFGVLVPPWWKKPALRLGVKLKAAPKSNGNNRSFIGLEGICAYQWEIALGDEKLSLDDFRKLARLKVPLVQVRGQWVELKKEEIDAALAFFAKRQTDGEMTAAEVLRIGLGVDAAQVGLPVVGIDAKGWLGDLINGEEKLTAIKTPDNFNGKLRPYQERGLSWLSFLNNLALGACLADDMGLGKTIQLLALLLAERANGNDGNNGKNGKNGNENEKKRFAPTLLICPMSVVGNWQREAERFAPALRVAVHHGAARLSGGAFAKTARNCDLMITTYALAARDEKLLGTVKWGRVCLDEAQNIKNSAAKQTKAICGLKAERRIALTGTPVENRLSELWSIMEFLNPGLLGAASDFRARFANPIERYRNEERAAILKRLTGPFILRRLKTDKRIIQDLPDKIEMKTFCNLTKEQASLYKAVVDDMMKKISESDGIQRKGLILSTMLKLKQVCNHPAHFLQDRSSLEGRSGKLARLEEMLEEILAEGDRALCFTQFAEMGQMLKEYLQQRSGQEVLFLHGATPKHARDEMVARFQGQNGPSIFLLSLKAGGTGLNLTAANQVIHFDRWWNPAVENQATDRAFRIGQQKNVQVRKFVCIGTLEERIDQMIEQKKELAERIVGTGEAWLTELSTAQIRELVALSADAVAED